MKKSLLGVCMALLPVLAASAQTQPEPVLLKTQPKLFAPGAVSSGAFDFNATFTPDGKVLYFSRGLTNWQRITILESKQQADGQWGPPQVAGFSGIYRDADPFIAPGGERLYFISDRPVAGRSAGAYHIWFSERQGKGWGEPQRLQGAIDQVESPVYPSVTADGYLYFSSFKDGDSNIYRCKIAGNTTTEVEPLSFNDPKIRDMDPVVSADGSFLIFTSGRQGSTTGADLYVSFRKGNDWSTPRPLGPTVNTATNQGQAGLSPDGKTLFFTSTEPSQTPSPRSKRADIKQVDREAMSHENGLGNIYAVDISEIHFPLSLKDQ